LGLLASAGVAALLLQAVSDARGADDGSRVTAASPPPKATPAARPLKATNATQTGTAGAQAGSASRFRAASADPLIEALTRELLNQGGSPPLALTEPEARCVAFGMLARLGPDVLVAIGAKAQPGAPIDISLMTRPEQEQLAAALVDCMDVRLLLADHLGAAGLSPGDVSCVAEQVTRDGSLAAVLRHSVLGDLDAKAAEQALAGPMAEALHRCQPGTELIRPGRAG
jgi:hypothetical protein